MIMVAFGVVATWVMIVLGGHPVLLDKDMESWNYVILVLSLFMGWTTIQAYKVNKVAKQYAAEKRTVCDDRREMFGKWPMPEPAIVIYPKEVSEDSWIVETNYYDDRCGGGFIGPGKTKREAMKDLWSFLYKEEGGDE